VRKLPQVLTLFDLSVLSSASMGPAYSLASTMGPMVAAAGTYTPLSLVVLTAIMLCVAVAFARLSRRWPNAGSSYSWIRNAFGSRVGAYGAWLLILSNFFATMSIAIPAGTYTLDLIAPYLAQQPIWDAGVGALWILGSSALLYAGLRPTALVTAIALAAEMAVLGITAVLAATRHHPVPLHAPGSIGAVGFIGAITLGIWMTDGWEVSASTSEEARNERSPGRGGLMGLLLTSTILCACMWAYLPLGTPRGFTQHQADAMTYVATLLGGSAWRYAIIATVLISTCATLWTTLLYLSRSLFAMGRDRVLPTVLGTLDRRNEPLVSLIVVGISVTVAELLTGFSETAAYQLTMVLNISSVFLGLLFAFSAAAAVRAFWRDRGRDRITGVIVPALGLLALLAVLIATVAFADRRLQMYALGGTLLGIPFAAWRGWAARFHPLGGTLPTPSSS